MATTGNYTLAMMAAAVGRATSCVQTWLNKFVAGGVDALVKRVKSTGRTTKLTEPLVKAIKQKLKTGDFRTAGQFRQWLASEHQIELKQATSYAWLGKCEGGLKAPRPCHRNQKAGAIDYFKTQGWAEKLSALDIPIGAPVEFWVMDEARFGLHTVVRHCWGLKGERVVKPFQQRFDFDYLYGAINVQSGAPVFCHMPSVTCEITWDFLRELTKTAPDSHHVVLWDGAGFHQEPPRVAQGQDQEEAARAAEYQDVAKVHLIKLPPYCPELNPSEKMWDLVKDEVCNRADDTIEGLREAMEPKLRSWWEQPGGLRSLVGYGKNWLGQQVNVC
jgi:transposase